MNIGKIFPFFLANPIRIFLLFFSLSILVYGNVVNGEFLFDDNTFIENNQFVKTANFKAIFTNGITQGSGLNDNFYRPLQQCLYVVSYKIGGEHTWAYHLWNILFHLMNAFLLFLLLKTVFPINQEIGLAVSLLFLLHPIQTQAVSYISGLSEPLSGFFVLSGLLCYANISRRRKFFPNIIFGLLALLVGTLAIFSKENGVILAPLSCLILLYRWNSEKEKPTTLQILIPIILLLFGLLFVYLKLTLLNFTGNFGLSNQENIYNEKLWVRLLTFINILPQYLRMMLFPVGLHYETPYTAYINLEKPQAIFTLILVLIWGVFAIVALRRKDFIPAFSLGWFFLAIAPVSGLIPLNSMYLEHWLYLPIIGFLFIVVYLINSLVEKINWIGLSLIPILLTFSGIIVARNKQWADPEKFYRNELKYTKKSARVYNNLAMVLADRKQCGKSIEFYQKAIQLYDIYPQSHHNLARCYEELGMLNEAANEYYKALLLNPNFLYSHGKLPGVLLKLGQKTMAENFLKLQIALENGQNLSQNDIKRAAQPQPL